MNDVLATEQTENDAIEAVDDERLHRCYLSAAPSGGWVIWNHFSPSPGDPAQTIAAFTDKKAMLQWLVENLID